MKINILIMLFVFASQLTPQALAAPAEKTKTPAYSLSVGEIAFGGKNLLGVEFVTGKIDKSVKLTTPEDIKRGRPLATAIVFVNAVSANGEHGDTAAVRVCEREDRNEGYISLDRDLEAIKTRPYALAISVRMEGKNVDPTEKKLIITHEQVDALDVEHWEHSLPDKVYSEMLSTINSYRFDCEEVVFPSRLDSEYKVKKINEDLREFSDCYNAYSQNFNLRALQMKLFKMAGTGKDSASAAQLAILQESFLDLERDRRHAETRDKETSDNIEKLKNSEASHNERVAAENRRIEAENDEANERAKAEEQRRYDAESYGSSNGSSDRFQPAVIPQRQGYVLPGAP